MYGWLFAGLGDFRTLNPTELRDLLGEKHAPRVLVDVREDNEWDSGHIPGAIHVPLSRFDQAAAKIPGDRPIIFYCHSGMRSKSALRRARKLGLKAEGHLGGGLSHWRRLAYPIAR